MLAVFSLAFALLIVPAASASVAYDAVPADPTPATGVTSGQTMVLASTGLDITVPVVIGLAVLVLGTVMVGWAFLATGRRSQHR